MNWVIESKRLGLRKIEREDFNSLCKILQDAEIMYAWEHGFTDEEVHQWIENNIARYDREGFSYFAVIQKSTGQLVGAMGPLIENIHGEEAMGIAYILNKTYWGQGYAVEGARACMEYAFDSLKASRVIAEIRPSNQNSCRVAERLGMKIDGEFVKHYKDMDMVHLIYSKNAADHCIGGSL